MPLTPGEARYLTFRHPEAVFDPETFRVVVTLNDDYSTVRVGVVDLDPDPANWHVGPVPVQIDPAADDPPTIDDDGDGFTGLIGPRTMMFRANEPLRDVASPGSGPSKVAFGPMAEPSNSVVFVVEGYHGAP